jgi:hypothetical protein
LNVEHVISEKSATGLDSSGAVTAP